MGNVEIGIYYCLTADVFDKSFTEMIAMATPLTYNGKNENETCHSLLSFSDILTKVLLNFYVPGVVLYLPYQFCPNW